MWILAECSDSDGRDIGIEGLLAETHCLMVESLCCVLEQDTLSAA